MDYSRELLFFFSALGAFNGLLLSFYFLFFARPRHLSNYFLGTLLLALSIRIGKSVFLYFNSDLAYDYLQLGLTACFFIGPSLFFYIKSVVQAERPSLQHWKYHYGGLAIIAWVVGYLYPFETHVDLWRCVIIDSIYYEWLAYILASAYLLKDVFKSFVQQKDKRNSVEIWLISLLLGNFIIWSGYYFWYFTSYISGALSFSFMLYLMILLLFFNKKKDTILFRKQPKYAAKKIEDSAAHQLLKKLEVLMEGEEIYRNPNLKLPDVAEKLNIIPHQLSQLVNDNLGKSFSTFINEYRIEAAKKMLVTHSEYSLDAIGYEAGFNSKSTFYAAFKKITGTTPAKYKKGVID